MSRNGLRPAHRNEERSGGGELRIFLCAFAGIGATRAMLRAAQQLRSQQIEVVVCHDETCGSVEDSELLVGLEALPRSVVHVDDQVHSTLDVDAVLRRDPDVLVVDELSRINPAGSHHPRRWQDIEELLGAGIDVLTTLDVQHLDSLNDEVFAITGVRITDTVPDRLLDRANDIVLVDVPAVELLDLGEGGDLHAPGPAPLALSTPLDRSRRLALREIALRRTAEWVNGNLRQSRREPGGGTPEPAWNVSDGLLVCVGPDLGDVKVVRAAGRRARRSGAPWHSVYVETPVLQRLPEARRRRVLGTLKLAESLGSMTATLAADAVATAIVTYAREHNLGTIVLGRSSRPHTKGRLRRRIAEEIADLGPEIELMLISRHDADAQEVAGPAADVAGENLGNEPRWAGYAWALASSLAVALAAMPLARFIDLTNIVMLFLLAEVLVAMKLGLRPALAAAVLNVIAFDFFFVPPRFSFLVDDVRYLPTFAVMTVVGLIVAQLTASSRFQARVALYRERRARILYELARELGWAFSLEDVIEVSKRTIEAAFRAKSAILVADADDRLSASTQSRADEPVITLELAQWAFDHAEAAGNGTDTRPTSRQLYVPLKTSLRNAGVLAIEPSSTRLLMIPEQRQLLDTFAALIASAIERVHLVAVAQETQVAMESERLRNSLLAALSHDLRTPLTTLIGMSEVLCLALEQEGSPQAPQARAITEQSARSSALVKNLLDMARLQAGVVSLHREWQSLEELAESAARSVEGALSEHPLHLRVPEDLPLIYGDGVLLERVLANLFENAAKYTPKGTPITLTAWCDDREILVEVSDDGPGLPSGDSDFLFQKFGRGAKESSTPGVGLGLSICQAIVRAHGGTIRAGNRAPPGHGAVFTWSIPYRDAPTLGELSDDTNGADESMRSALA